MMSVPMICVPDPNERPDGVHVIQEREEYLGDHNNPIMAIVTKRGDGSNDTTVYPEIATAIFDK